MKSVNHTDMKISQIKVAKDKSDYEIYDDFLNIKINDQWLDEILHHAYPDAMYSGLIPTLLPKMIFDTESEIVWQRILPECGQKTICPVLMCPDDLDFSCTLIMAEIETLEDAIIWYRLGIDTTQATTSDMVGSEIEWLDKILPYKFLKTDYLEVIQTFLDHKNRLL